MVAPVEGHIFHNRLTHTLEVAQIARRLAEKLLADEPRLASRGGGIDPDVAEAAALAHDLGHPPFGHVAEKALDALAKEAGDPDGFEGNAQSFRILTYLAAHRDAYRGLNLTRATLNATLKYPWLRYRGSRAALAKRKKKYGAYRTEADELRFARSGDVTSGRQSLEAAIMDHADNVAYSVHDLDDFYRAGLIPIDKLLESDAEYDTFFEGWLRDNAGRINVRLATTRRNALRELLYSVSTEDWYRGTFDQRARLRTATSNLIGDYVWAATLVSDSRAGARIDIDRAKELEMQFLQSLVWRFVIRNPRLATQQHGQQEVIRTLFRAFLRGIMSRDLDLIPPLFADELNALGRPPRRNRRPQIPEIRLATDIVASLTDVEASLLHRRLLGVTQGSVVDLLFS